MEARMKRVAISGAIALLLAVTPAAAETPTNWDGLLSVKAHHLDAVYLLPQADFRGYTKVMLEPTEVAFRKNWQRDTNQEIATGRVSDEDARRVLEDARAGFEKVIQESYQKAGYQVVTSPGPDVLRVATAVVNLDLAAPDLMSAGRSKTWSREAGSATLVVEARDSLTGDLLGRAVDAQSTGDFGPYLRNSVTNASEFHDLFRRWGKVAADGLNELKTLSPIDASGKLVKK
jgi:hypothetical protein